MSTIDQYCKKEDTAPAYETQSDDDWTCESKSLGHHQPLRHRIHTNGPCTIDEELFSHDTARKKRVKWRPRFSPYFSSLPMERIPNRPWYQVLMRAWLNSRTWLEAWAWVKRHKRLVGCILLCIPFILRPSRLWMWPSRFWNVGKHKLNFFWHSKAYLFGKHNIHGGVIGKRIERWGDLERYDEVQSRQQSSLQSLGITLPPRIPTDRSMFRVLEIDTQAAIRNILVRRELRSLILADLERQADMPRFTCGVNSLDSNETRKSSVAEKCSIPKVIFVPDISLMWQPPRPGQAKSYRLIYFNQPEMRQLVQDTLPDLSPVFDKLAKSPEAQINLWAVCAVYYFGGLFVDDRSKYYPKESLQSLLWFEDGNILDRHTKPFAVAALDGLNHFQVLAATPRHPGLFCLLRHWENLANTNPTANISDLHREIVPHVLPDLDPNSEDWTRVWASRENHDGQPSCHFKVDPKRSHNIFPSGDEKNEEAEIYFQKYPEIGASHPEPRKVQVSVQEKALPVVKRTEKVTLESQLIDKGLDPGWLCMRCVKMPQLFKYDYGQVERCSWFCPAGYSDLICHGPDVPEKQTIPVNILVRGAYGDYRSETLIPKVIHQTWFENISKDRYPQLARLQRSWRNSGWDYRLYTDETARAYIVDNFPPRFVDAFDVLIPGAYKADLFRYLVLLKEGGVYADVDVLLETDLDRFITPSLSFFAPRDIVLEFAGEPFCLWNGLLGAAPGHPFIVRAVERLVNLILDRADVYDMERDLCRNKKDPLDAWKLWGQTLLFLSGPCALGVAMNEVLGRSSMETIETGWIGLDGLEYGGKKDHGDALILIADKHDMEGFRISDPEWGTIIASTNLDGTEKHARELRHAMKAELKRQRKRKKKKLIHYSESSRNIPVWGSSGVYADKMVTNERIILNVRYEPFQG